jgi:aerobic-type carbon monoxide dehydrogenase small subunit (CoxS/CutS family)
MNAKLIDVKLTVNGASVERRVRADKLLIDFLHEELDLTGTKFSCGIGACGACKVSVQEAPDSELLPVLACFARMNAVDGMHITTVEGLSSGEALHPLQRAFLDDYSFQCGFSTPGFLMAGHVLIDQLRRAPVPQSKLDQRILDAIGGHVCRCTGYVRYFDAIKRVIESTPGLVVEEAPAVGDRSAVTFRIVKQSSNDLQRKVLLGRFERPTGSVEFAGGLDFDTCRGSVTLRTAALTTGEPARDLNLANFFFVGAEEIRFELERAEPIDRGMGPSDLLEGVVIPMAISGTLHFDVASLPASMEVFAQSTEAGRLRITSRAPLRFDPRDLGFAVAPFAEEFGLELSTEVEVTFDLNLPYVVR